MKLVKRNVLIELDVWKRLSIAASIDGLSRAEHIRQVLKHSCANGPAAPAPVRPATVAPKLARVSNDWPGMAATQPVQTPPPVHSFGFGRPLAPPVTPSPRARAPEPREIYQSPFTLREGSVGPECVNREGWLKKMWDADGRETDPDMEWFDFERDGQVPPEVREALSMRLRRKLDDAGKVEADPTPGVADIENQE